MKVLLLSESKDEIRTWYFEAWNEPHGWPVEGWLQFHRLYAAFADAVLSVDKQLKIGGYDSFKQDSLHDFLEHVSNGREERKLTDCIR